MHLPDNCANEKGRKLTVKLTWVSRKIVEFFPISTADTFTKQAHFHTIYTRNNMGQKCEGNCGLWVLNKILKKTYPEILKKIVGAVWEIPAK